MTSGAIFETALTEREQRTLLSSSGFSGLSVDVREATAWDARDAVRIREACETVGCDVINRRVQEVFATDQIRRTVEKHANSPPDEWSAIDCISLSGLCISRSEGALLAGYVSSAAKPITTVLLWDCTGPRDAFTDICKSLSECAGLNRVLISNETHVETARRGSTDITESTTENFGFGGTAVTALAMSLINNPEVKIVQINGTAMNSDDFAAFANVALGAHSHVVELDVERHDELLAGDAPATVALAASLGNNTTLKRLRISSTGLDDAAPLAIARAVGANPASVLAIIDTESKYFHNPGMSSVGSEALKRATLAALRQAAAKVPSPPESVDPSDPSSNGEETEQLDRAWHAQHSSTDLTDMEDLLALLARTEAELGHVDEAIAAYEHLIVWTRRVMRGDCEMSRPRRLKAYVCELATVNTDMSGKAYVCELATVNTDMSGGPRGQAARV